MCSNTCSTHFWSTTLKNMCRELHIVSVADMYVCVCVCVWVCVCVVCVYLCMCVQISGDVYMTAEFMWRRTDRASSCARFVTCVHARTHLHMLQMHTLQPTLNMHTHWYAGGHQSSVECAQLISISRSRSFTLLSPLGKIRKSGSKRRGRGEWGGGRWKNAIPGSVVRRVTAAWWHTHARIITCTLIHAVPKKTQLYIT